MGGKYAGNKQASGFVCDLTDLFAAPVAAFASGHVHSNVDFMLNGVRSVSNALGYTGEHTGYRGDTVLHFS